MSKTPLLVDPDGLSPEKELGALAFALHASVVQDGRALRIERSAPDRIALRRAHVAANRARLVDTMAKWDRILLRADALGSPASQVRHARADVAKARQEAHQAAIDHRPYALPSDLMGEFMVTPVGRLLYGIMIRLGPDRIADEESEACRFWSDHPNSVESRLPACDDLLAEYQRAQAAYSAAMDLPEPDRQATKVILTTSGGIGSLDLYDAQGKRVGHGYMTADMKPLLVGTADAARTTAEPRWIDLDLDLATRRMNTLFHPTHEASERLPHPSIVEPYFNPERFDPSDFAVRTGLLAMPRLPKTRGFVAALSDASLVIASSCVREDRFDVAEFERRLFSEGGFQRVAQNGATIVRPSDPTTAEFVDRVALGRAVRQIANDGDISLRNEAALYFATYPAESLATGYC